MKGKRALSTALCGMIAGVILFSACGSDGDQEGATEDVVAATATITSAVSRDMLKSMILSGGDLPGFVISDARFLDNEGASAQAPDPAASRASLDEMGRIVGFHAIFNQFDAPPPGAPSVILWSVNLFQQPSGALDFTSRQPTVPNGFTVEPVNVSTLGPYAVGWAFRRSDPDKPASSYGIAFADGVVQVSLTTLYEDAESSPDYTLNLAQQAQTLVETALGSGSAQPSPQAEGAAPDPPTATPVGITAPTHLHVGSP